MHKEWNPRYDTIYSLMAKFAQRLRARDLRRNGWSVGSIARELKVSKGTASLWCQDIFLTLEQRELLFRNAKEAGVRGRFLGAESNRKKKLKTIDEAAIWAKKKAGEFTERDLLIAGIALYWAEGSKKGVNRFTFVNSDPEMIRLMCEWLEKIMNIPKSDLYPRVAINSIHEPRINVVIKFWSDLLSIPEEQFRRPTYIRVPPKKVYENYHEYFGILRLSVRNSSFIRHRVLALIDLLVRERNRAGVAQLVRASVS